MNEDKPLFIFVSGSHCSYCKKELKLFNSDKKFVEKINSKFIPVYIIQDKDYVPNHLLSQVTPTFYFVDNDGEYLTEPIRGALPLSVFYQYTKIALKIYNK